MKRPYLITQFNSVTTPDRKQHPTTSLDLRRHYLSVLSMGSGASRNGRRLWERIVVADEGWKMPDAVFQLA